MGMARFAHCGTKDVSIDLPGLVRQGASRFGEYMASQLGAVVRNIVVFLFELFVMLFALFYFLRDGDSILDRFRLFLPFEETMRERMLAEARELIFASVTTSLVIAAVQGVICGGAFAIVGLGSPLFLGRADGVFIASPRCGRLARLDSSGDLAVFDRAHRAGACPDCDLRRIGLDHR